MTQEKAAGCGCDFSEPLHPRPGTKGLDAALLSGRLGLSRDGGGAGALERGPDPGAGREATRPRSETPGLGLSRLPRPRPGPRLTPSPASCAAASRDPEPGRFHRCWRRWSRSGTGGGASSPGTRPPPCGSGAASAPRGSATRTPSARRCSPPRARFRASGGLSPQRRVPRRLPAPDWSGPFPSGPGCRLPRPAAPLPEPQLYRAARLRQLQLRPLPLGSPNRRLLGQP